MSESEIRAVLREVCDELDRRARQLLLPAIVGAGLALAGCGDDSKPVPAYGVPAYGVPMYDARVEQGAVALYSAPAPDGGRRAETSPPQPEYMAPAPDAK
jgi:hypothetical protein